MPASPDADFPEGFLFGSSTAAHQVEGGNANNDWWAWEHAAGTPAVEPSGDAIDQYHRYAEDFAARGARPERAPDVARVVAHRARAGRVQPRGARALPARARLAGRARARGIRGAAPLLQPALVRRPRGWAARDAVERFERFCARVADALGDLMPWACTINEPQIVARVGYLEGWFPPGVCNPGLWRQVTRTFISAHAAAVRALGAGAGDPKAGICLQLPDFVPARPGDADCEAFTAEMRSEMADVYLEDLEGDFVGVQYYTRERLDPGIPGHDAAPPEGAPLTQMGWELNPDGLGRAIRLAAGSGLPVVITENGIATADDGQRVDYMRSHLDQVAQALRDGIDVRGFMYWSAFDNFEWNEGYRPLFGLVGIDRDDDLRRVVRPSARAYGELAKSRSLRVFEEAASG